MKNVKNPALFSAAVLAYVAKAAPNGHYSYSESQWGQSECKSYYEQHGFQKEYASSCKSYYSEQYSGSWSSGDCEVLYDCWSGDELKKSYPDYYSKCSSYGGSFGGSKEVYYESKYGGGQWGESECKVYFDQYGFQKEYATACKEWYGKQWSGSCTEQECKVLYECWNGDELKVSYPDYYSKCSSYGGSYGGGYTKEVYYESKYGGGQWDEAKCKVYFDQYGFQKEYATACKEWYGKQWSGSCTEQECKVIYECWNGDEFKVSYPDYFTKCSSYGGSYGGGYGGGRIDKWDDNKCKAVWDEHYKKPAYLARRQGGGLTTTVTDIVTVPTSAPTQAPSSTVITTVITVPTSAPTSVTTSVLTSSGVTVTVTNTVTDTTKGPRPTDYPVIPIYPCDTCEKGKGHGEYIYGGKGGYGNGGKGEIVYGGKGGNGYDGSWEEYTIYCKEYNDKYHGGYNGGWNGDYKGDYDYKGNGDYKGDYKGDKEYKGDNKGDYDYKGNGDYKGDNKGEYPAPPKAEYPKVEPPKTEYPKVEPPKTEYPKVEPPKAEYPKVEPPKTSVAPKPPKTSDYPITPDVKVDCKNPSYYHHKDCIVVVSGASAMFTVAGGLMTAALALGAML